MSPTVKCIPETKEKYSVSTEGDVFGPRGKLKPTLMAAGYTSVALRRNGKEKREYVHRLVAEAFLGGIPAGNVVDHIDGGKENNRLDNLRTVTRSENTSHFKSQQVADSDKDYTEAAEIKWLVLNTDIPQAAINKKYGRSQTYASDIELGKLYSYVDPVKPLVTHREDYVEAKPKTKLT